MNNIKDIITFNRTKMENYIDEMDFLDLIESCLHLIHHIILNDPMIFSNPDIKNIILNNITHLLSLQIENIVFLMLTIKSLLLILEKKLNLPRFLLSVVLAQSENQ